MGKRREIDPFDVKWQETDPLNREVLMLNSIATARELGGKHQTYPERLEIDEVREVVRDPNRIDVSSSNEHRNVYYRDNGDSKHPLSRAVVDFSTDENKGAIISWSRYERHASCSYVLWEREDK